MFPTVGNYKRSCCDGFCVAKKLLTLLGRSMIFRWYDRRKFSVVRNCQTVFQRGYTILHFHKEWIRVPVTPHPHQYLMLSVFCTLVILIGVQWCPVGFNLTYNVEHLFTCLFAIFGLLFNRVFAFLSFKSSLYMLDKSPFLDVIYEYFFLVCGFHPINRVFHRLKIIILM